MKISDNILSLFYNLTATASKLSEKIVILFTDRSEIKDALKKATEYSEFEKKLEEFDIIKQTVQERTNVVKVYDGFSLLCLVLVHLEKHSPEDISIHDWETMLLEIKQRGGPYVSEIKKQYREAFRHLARYLDGINKLNSSNGFLSFVEVPKNSNILLMNYVNTPLIADAHPYKKWINAYRCWLEEKVLKNSKHHWEYFHALICFLTDNKHPTDIDEYLIRLTKTKKSNFIQYLQDNDYKALNEIISYISDFTLWYSFTNLSLESDDNDEQAESSFGESIPTSLEILTFNKKPVENKPTSNTSTKTRIPTQYIFEIQDLLSRNDYEWAKSLPSEYIEHDTKGKTWCPCNTYLLLTMLEIPLRRIQVSMLDSGEGDSIKYSINDNKWIENTGNFQNYWKSIGQQKVNRGVISYDIERQEKTSIYINTNKNADRSVLFSADSGYTIPWHNQPLVDMLTDLREWQEKYNPVSKPTKYTELNKNVSGDKMPTESVLKSIPDRFYLFRHPKTSSGEKPFSPLPDVEIFRFWWQVLLQVQNEWNKKNPDTPIQLITKYNKNTNTPEGAIFTPHGLRVSGITALVESGVPLEVISKIIVAHSSLIATVHYVKHDKDYINNMLDSAKKHLQDVGKIDLFKALNNDTFENAKKYLVYNSIETVGYITSKKIPSALITPNNLGICPYGFTRCSDGGPLIRKTHKNKPLHSRVEGGDGTCVLCRHFVTGVPWLTEIWLYTNKCLEELRDISVIYDSLKSRLEEKRLEKYNLVKNSVSETDLVDISRKIAELSSLYELKAAEMDLTLKKLHAAFRILEGLKAIIDHDSDSDSKKLPIASDESSLAIEFSDVSLLSVKHLLVKAGRLYPHMEDDKTESERNYLLDKILFNNGLEPITLLNLTKKEIEAASDAMGDFLLSRLSADQIDDLSTNKLKLSDLGINNKDLITNIRIEE